MTEDAERIVNDMRHIADTKDQEEMSRLFKQLDSHMTAGGLLPKQWSPAANPGRPGRPPLPEGEVLEGVEHGRVASYRKGCRCYRCRGANATSARIRQQRSKEQR